MKRLAVINVVGLTQSCLGKHMPNITALANASSVSELVPPLPAVTCSVQASLLTGLNPSEHGIVANGWHERTSHETFFWRQSNELVQGEKVWDKLHATHKDFTVANMFWWFNMYSSVDFAVTPRPIYRANGRKFPDIWTHPPSLRLSLQKKYGQFPLFSFWGPTAGITSTKWIVNATIEVDQKHQPTLSFVYVPHLDYSMQRLGPNHAEIARELRAVDSEVGRLIDHFSKQGVQVCVLSEYGIEQVDDAVAINRVLRSNEYLAIREERGREYLDAGASKAFAVPDHQIAHVYVKNQQDVSKIASLLQNTSGIEYVLCSDERGNLMHDRCGDIVAISRSNSWFSHDWWDKPSSAPDYQATVDIHRKPGYDPRELFFADGWQGCKTRIAMKLLWKKLGGNSLLDVITLDPTKVKGSHGRTPEMGAPSPILIAPECAKEMPQSLPAAAFKNYLISWITS